MARLILIKITCVLSLAAATPTVAQDINVQASVSNTKVPLNHTLTYTVSVTGDKLPGSPLVKLPSFGTLQLVARNQNQIQQIINGVRSITIRYSNTLKPTETGQFTIPAATIKIGTKTYTTQPVDITITEPVKNKRPSAQQAIDPFAQFKFQVFPELNQQRKKTKTVWVKTELSRSRVYVGEEVEFKLKLIRRYSNIQLWEQPTIGLPSFEGLWVEPVTANSRAHIIATQNTNLTVNDLVVRKLLPLKPGTITIDPAKVGLVLDPFLGQQVFESNPLQLTALALPPGAPPEFTGVVGNFKFTGMNKPKVATQNTPLTLTISLTGKGNLDSIKDLVFNASNQVKIYKSSVSTHHPTENAMTYRVFEYILIPKNAGKISVPRFKLSFFSPTQKHYKTITSQPFDIQVTAQPQSASTPKDAPKSIAVLDRDIAYLKTSTTSPFLTHLRQVILAILALANLALLGLIGVKLLDRFKSRGNPLTIRQKNAYKTFLATIKNRHSQDSIRQINTLNTALIQFLSDKLGTSTKGLTSAQLKTALAQTGLSQQHHDTLIAIFDKIGYMAYTPSQISSAEIDAITSEITELVTSIKDWTPAP